MLFDNIILGIAMVYDTIGDMERTYHPNRGFLKWRYPKMVSLCHGNSHRSKWMITRGSPILGKPPHEFEDGRLPFLYGGL